MRRPGSLTVITSVFVATFSARNDAGKLDPGPPAPTAATEPTEANLKVAFIGNIGDEESQRSLFALVRREHAQLVVFQGGLTSKGNDSFVHKGLKVVYVDEVETMPSRIDYVTQELSADDHLWKVCSWRKSQRDAQIGPGADEMGWEIYERCRRYGAIVAQGHSHTYSRSKTLTSDVNLTIDTSCSDSFALCVGEGRHFFFDSSLAGRRVRSAVANLAARPYFAQSFTGSFGALFIEFNVEGDPRRAEGYFKTTTDLVMDPPRSSGKTTFTITRLP